MSKKNFHGHQYYYLMCCVHAEAEEIQEMMYDAIEVKYNTFIKHVNLRDLNEQFGYGMKGNIHLKDDFAVRYFKGKFRGHKVYIMVHSAIEYIFA